MILYGSTANHKENVYSSYKEYLMDVYNGDFRRYSADDNKIRVCEVTGFENLITNNLNLFYERMEDGLYKFISNEMGESRYLFAKVEDQQIKSVFLDEEQKKENNLKFLLFLEEGKWAVADSREKGLEDLDLQNVMDSIFADSGSNIRIMEDIELDEEEEALGVD